MKSFLITLICLSAPVLAQDISRARAAELSLHRIERLVILKRIDADFLSKIHGVQVDTLTAATADDPSYKATTEEFAGADHSLKSIAILETREGRVLSNAVSPGTVALDAPLWLDKDAVTLCENSLHFVLETTDPQFFAWRSGFRQLVLSQGHAANGDLLAVVDMKSVETPKALRVLIKAADGSFVSAQIIE